jgi:hypothetical protein
MQAPVAVAEIYAAAEIFIDATIRATGQRFADEEMHVWPFAETAGSRAREGDGTLELWRTGDRARARGGAVA